MYCGARCATTRQAITATILIGLIGTTLVPWGLGTATTAVLGIPEPFRPRFFWREPPPMAWPEAVGRGLTPPWVLARSVVPYELYPRAYWFGYDAFGRSLSDGEAAMTVTLGLFAYFVAGLLLAGAARRRFRRSLGSSGLVGREGRRQGPLAGRASSREADVLDSFTPQPTSG
jgi:hypothetical protein